MYPQSSTPPLIQCACGCGRQRPQYDSDGRERWYICGHNSRPPTTGRKKHGGYIEIKCRDHPRVAQDGYIGEQRLVMEAKLGRYLEPTEVVHHIDGNRENNDPANLMLFSNNGEHVRFHALERRR